MRFPHLRDRTQRLMAVASVPLLLWGLAAFVRQIPGGQTASLAGFVLTACSRIPTALTPPTPECAPAMPLPLVRLTVRRMMIVGAIVGVQVALFRWAAAAIDELRVTLSSGARQNDELTARQSRINVYAMQATYSERRIIASSETIAWLESLAKPPDLGRPDDASSDSLTKVRLAGLSAELALNIRRF